MLTYEGNESAFSLGNVVWGKSEKKLGPLWLIHCSSWLSTSIDPYASFTIQYTATPHLRFTVAVTSSSFISCTHFGDTNLASISCSDPETDRYQSSNSAVIDNTKDAVHTRAMASPTYDSLPRQETHA